MVVVLTVAYVSPVTRVFAFSVIGLHFNRSTFWNNSFSAMRPVAATQAHYFLMICSYFFPSQLLLLCWRGRIKWLKTDKHNTKRTTGTYPAH